MQHIDSFDSQEPQEYMAPPAYYQSEDVLMLYQNIWAGDSVHLLGSGSVGKSNLLRMLPRWDVKNRHLAQDGLFYLPVVLSPYLLVHPNAALRDQVGDLWHGYELMVKRTIFYLHQLRLSVLQHANNAYKPLFKRDYADDHDLVEHLKEIYDKFSSNSAVTTQSGLRHLQDVIYEVLYRDLRMKVCFLFDELETFMDLLPPQFFQSLRGLRDEYKGRITYICTSRKSLSEIIQQKTHEEDSLEYSMLESFTELFDGHEHYVRPLNSQSIEFTLARQEHRTRSKIESEEAKKSLIRLTGGHAGLLRRGFISATEFTNQNYKQIDFIRRLLANQGAYKQCKTIFYSLNPDEQAALKLVACEHGKSPDTAIHEIIARVVPYQVKQSLVKKHIFTEQEDSYNVNIPILTSWIFDTYCE